jgi:hypothetical protein
MNTSVQMNEKMHDLQNTLAHWQRSIDLLNSEIKNIEKDSQQEYLEKISVLQQQLDNLKVRLRVMAEGDSKEWIKGRPEFLERLAKLRGNFMKTAEEINNEDKTVELGWLQGFSDQRHHDSSGWMEGLGKRPEDSEGWAEGMGKKGSDSKGWSEGYK